MNRNKLFIIIFLLIIPFCVLSQVSKTEAIKRFYEIRDSLRGNYTEIGLDQAIKLCNQQQKYAEVSEDSTLIGISIYVRAFLLRHHQIFESAIIQYKIARKILKDRDKDYLLRTYNDVGLIYNRLKQPLAAMKEFKEGIKILSLPEMEEDYRIFNNNIGLIFFKHSLHAKAKAYFEKAVYKYPDRIGQRSSITHYHNLALIYSKSNQIDSAKRLLDRAKVLEAKWNDYSMTGNRYIIKINVYVKSKEYDSALVEAVQGVKDPNTTETFFAELCSFMVNIANLKQDTTGTLRFAKIIENNLDKTSMLNSNLIKSLINYYEIDSNKEAVNRLLPLISKEEAENSLDEKYRRLLQEEDDILNLISEKEISGQVDVLQRQNYTILILAIAVICLVGFIIYRLRN